jgi:hypothetical protein
MMVMVLVLEVVEVVTVEAAPEERRSQEMSGVSP